MARLSLAQFLAKYAATNGRFANNTSFQIGPDDWQEFAQDIGDSLAGTANQLLGAPKVVRYRHSTTAGVPAGASTLDRLAPASLCVGNEAVVLNPSATPILMQEPPKRYVLARLAAPEVGSINASLDADPATVLTAPCLWLPVDDPNAVGATLPYLDRAAVALEGSTYKYVLGGRLRLFEVLQDLDPEEFTGTGPQGEDWIPEPSGLLNDPYYEEISPESLQAQPRFQPISREEYLTLAADDGIQNGLGYLISRDGEGIYVWGIGPNVKMYAQATLIVGDGSTIGGSYDVENDVFVPAGGFSGDYNDLTNRPSLGSAAARDVNTSGNANVTQVVLGTDTRLTNARAPTPHTHPAADISDSTTAGRALLTASDAAAQRTALGLGSAATRDAPASGNASAAQVVLGSDGRLSDARATTLASVASFVIAGGGVTLTNTGTAISIGANLSVPGGYGDGSDGALVVSAGQTVNLSRDMYYTSILVQNGGTLHTNGFRIFTTGNATIDAGGVVHNDGVNGGNANGAAAGSSGVAKLGITVGGSGAGTSGANGSTGAGNSAGAVGAAVGAGGNSGTAAAAGSGGAGAGGAAVPAVTTTQRFIRFLTTQLLIGAALMQGGSSARGGSSGAGDGTNSGGGGGGGPSAGGVVALFIGGTLTNNGTIRARGGNGGNGGTPPTGNCGGGTAAPGAGGGSIYIDSNSYAGLGSISMAGGAGGAAGSGVGTGTAGSIGTAGTGGAGWRIERATATATILT